MKVFEIFQIIKQTLDPFWDQTLILPPKTIHGSKEYIKSNPPRAILQVYDEDICVSEMLF